MRFILKCWLTFSGIQKGMRGKKPHWFRTLGRSQVVMRNDSSSGAGTQGLHYPGKSAAPQGRRRQLFWVFSYFQLQSLQYNRNWYIKKEKNVIYLEAYCL